ncbi:Hypothetical predicted protein [Pelobates cultripes]|uniref:Uncharacterized protein n=1 Tax=Pelobates cultripes TaxID=61616 RepID=A0AAD1VS85_PELCU|nr:Hypothetical predicted protein [Pelobates cultripes]
MSQHRAKKTAEAKDKSAFFAARMPQHKPADHQTQDGADPDYDADCVCIAGKQEDVPLTQRFLQTMLDAAVPKMQTTVTEAINDMRKYLTDLDACASHLEDNMENLTTAHNATEVRLSKIEEQLYIHETKIEDRR